MGMLIFYNKNYEIYNVCIATIINIYLYTIFKHDAWFSFILNQIFSGNVRENILFGKEYDEERYNEIVHVCALKDDLKQLPYGDMSEVGDRGNSLSGGQKVSAG